MRAGARLSWRVATAVAFCATAALAVALSRGAPSSAALASDKGADQHSAALCAESGLRISVGPGDRVTSGVTRYPLDFTNVSAAPCTISGYPQVAAYRGEDVQVGDAATDDRTVPADRILLAPGQTAYATLDASLSPGRCRPVLAAGLRVVSPGQSAARYVPRPLTACAGQTPRGPDYLRVRAVQRAAAAGSLADPTPSAAARPD